MSEVSRDTGETSEHRQWSTLNQHRINPLSAVLLLDMFHLQT